MIARFPCPDSGHGFLFQHPEEFAGGVLEFLAAPRPGARISPGLAPALE
jgi:hypothetical protein